MTPEKWNDLENIFDSLMAHQPEEREAEFARIAPTLDSLLRAELRRLLDHAEPASGFLRSPLAMARLVGGRRFQDGELLADRFRIVRLLGRGGMGEVYEAFDSRLNEPVALKIILPKHAPHQKSAEMLLREVRVARKITNPHICRIHDVGEHLDCPYFTMELLRGRTVADRLADAAPLTAGEWEMLASQLFEGLAAAHAMGVIHRDLKPSNLMLADSGSRLIILDFGLARPLDDEETAGITKTGVIVGTLDWMAPEQLQGRCDARSDIYSAGLILFHALMPSSNGLKPGLAGALQRATSDTNIARELPAHLPYPIRRMLAGCLERDPERRWQTVTEARKSLRGGRTWRALPVRTLAGAILVTLLALFLWRFRLHDRAGIQPGSMVLVVPTMNTTGDSRFDGVTTTLGASLAQSAYLNVWHSDRLPAVLTAMRKPPASDVSAKEWREIAFRENAALTVFSTVARLGDEYTLTLRCERMGRNPATPAGQWEDTESATGPQALFEAVHRAANWVRRVAGEQAAVMSEHDRLPQEVASDNWEALALFDQASRLQNQGNDLLAIATLRRALTLDPQFASGLMKLGDILDSQEQVEDGFRYWQQAIELSRKQGLSDHERLRIESRYQYEMGDFPAAEAALRQWAQQFPNDPEGIRLLAACLQDLGRFDESAGLLRGLIARFGPSRERVSTLIWALVEQGRPREVEEQAGVLEKLDQETLALRFRGIARVMSGDYTGAREQFRKLAEIASGDEGHRVPALLAALAAEQGHIEEARNCLRDGIAADLGAGETGLAADKRLALAFLYLASGDRASAREFAWDAAAAQQGFSTVAKAVTILARAGYLREAREVSRKFPAIPGLRNRNFRLRMEGEIAAASGNFNDAVDDMQHAARIDSAWSPKEYLARVLLLAGQRERALEIYRDIARRPEEDWLDPDTQWPGLRYFANVTLHSPQFAKGETDDRKHEE